MQPVTPWCPNPSPRWSLLRRRRRRTGRSMDRREQRTSSPTQTKPHLQARSRGQQRTSSLRWTSTNCYSCRPLSFTSVCPATRPRFCRSPESDGTVASLSKTNSSIPNQYCSSVGLSAMSFLILSDEYKNIASY